MVGLGRKRRMRGLRDQDQGCLGEAMGKVWESKPVSIPLPN